MASVGVFRQMFLEDIFQDECYSYLSVALFGVNE